MTKGFVIKAVCFTLVIFLMLDSLVLLSEEGLTETTQILYEKAETIAVEAYGNTTAVLRADGTVWGWGDNSSGVLGTSAWDEGNKVFEPLKIEGLENIVSISMGNGYLLALKGDGTVWSLGFNTQGVINADRDEVIIRKPVKIKNLEDIKEVSAGINYAMALKKDGTAYIWGNYRYKSESRNKHEPKVIRQAHDVVYINASRYNAFIIDSSSKPWFCMGYLHKPIEINNIPEVYQISESGNRTYALDKNGSLWHWSINGQIVSKLEGISEVKSVTTGGSGTAAALDCNGSVWEWAEKDMMPKKKECIGSVKAIACGNKHIVALAEDGTIWSWGDNSFGQLGNGGGFFTKEPAIIDKLENIDKITASETYAAALKNDGTVWTWGSNKDGQLGDGTRKDRYVPAKIAELDGVSEISAGCSHMLALKNDGTVWAWGSNGSGELGDGTYEDRLAPVQVEGLSKVIAIAAGKEYSIALTSNRRVWVWGNSAYEPRKKKKDWSIVKPQKIEELSGIVAIDAGYECAMAVSSEGNIWGWGNNINGQLGGAPKEGDNIIERPRVISGCSDMVSVSIGVKNVLGLSSDGEVKAWGNNEFEHSEMEDIQKFYSPRKLDGLSEISAVYAGGDQNFAIRNTGEIFAWGNNSYWQISPYFEKIVETPTEVGYLRDIRQISAESKYTIALGGDDTVYALGDNTYGQLGIGNKTSSFSEIPVQVVLP